MLLSGIEWLTCFSGKTMTKKNQPSDKTVELNAITPDVDELCTILAQAVERLTKAKPAKSKDKP
jgi:hypothetical protein